MAPDLAFIVVFKYLKCQQSMLLISCQPIWTKLVYLIRITNSNEMFGTSPVEIYNNLQLIA